MLKAALSWRFPIISPVNDTGWFRATNPYDPRWSQKRSKLSSMCWALFAISRESMLVGLDEFVLHVKTESCIRNVNEKFLLICRDHIFFISLPNFTFFATIIWWCGRIDDAEVVRMSCSNYNGVRKQFKPEKPAELCQFLHCRAWMASSILRSAESVSQLYDILEKAYSTAGKEPEKQ